MSTTFGSRRQSVLTEDQIALIGLAIERIVDASGWGSVEVVIERGRVEAVRTTTSQLFLDSLAPSRPTTQSRGRDERGGR